MSEYIIDGSDRRSTKAARNASIYEEREAGAKFIEIANKYGLTVERVRQIWRKEQWYRSRFDGLQPIVRCRDCKFRHTVRSWLGMDVEECWLHADHESGALGKEPTELDGFCAWGERRDA